VTSIDDGQIDREIGRELVYKNFITIQCKTIVLLTVVNKYPGIAGGGGNETLPDRMHKTNHK
jgi:hypothetical protein